MRTSILVILLIGLFSLGACHKAHKPMPPGHDPDGPGNSENAPGHNK